MALSGSGWIRIILSDLDRRPGHPVPDLDFFTQSGSRVQRSKRHQISDPGSATLVPGKYGNLKIPINFVLRQARIVRTPLNLIQSGRVSDPDPYWFRIQSGQWIRIRIRNPDPGPGGQK
jgi:hypothetical protein